MRGAASQGGNARLSFEEWGYRHASRRHFAVRGLNLDIPPGQRVLLLGASGIGKSTILAGAAGLLGADEYADGEYDAEAGGGANEKAGAANAGNASLPVRVQAPARVDADGGMSEGRILVDGVPTQQARGRVGLVLQDPDAQTIFERLGDNVAFGPENMNVARGEIWRRVERALAAVGLEGLQLHRSTLHLSGGQMQRLALAGALAMRPGILLLDEPTANLDPDGVQQIVRAVGDVLEAQRCTMVLVEHRAEPWIDLIDRVIVLGLEGGTPDEGTDEDSGEEVHASTVSQPGSSPVFRRTMIVADGTPDEVFQNDSIDFAGLGIWVPQRYRRAQDAISRIHSVGEPAYPPEKGIGEPLLSTASLAIGRGGKAIASDIDLVFRPGQITALVGANGAGKSTLSLTLAGLLAPVGGRVVASPALQGDAGDDAPKDWHSTELASRISYVFQNPEHQFARGSVLDEVMLGPLRTGADETAAKAIAISLLERFGLRQYAGVNPYTLSGGEKRRLTVAASLAAAPRVLILDEPTFGQDRRTWMQIVTLIHGLRGDGVSIIVVTHDRELVTALGARIVELTPQGAYGEWDHAAETTPSDAQSSGGRELASANPPSTGPLPNDFLAAQGLDAHASDCDAARIAVSPVNTRDEAPRPSSSSRFLASLNPSFRLFGGFLASLPMMLSLDWVSATTALGLELVALMAIGFTPWRIVRSTWPIFIGAPGSALAVLLYGKSGGAVWWQWGMISVTDRSADLALATGIRILAVGIPAIIAVLGIDATDLADSFSENLHLPDRFVYGGLAGMRLFSVLRDDWEALSASRRSRGLGDENRLKAFFPQAFALLVLSIRRSTMLATAMQARGFGGAGPRSHARVAVVHIRDYAFLAACLAVPVIALVTAGFAGSFAFFGG
ncbi:ATP-binding cassette domain-containing protein [Bifidobacterium sp.]|uniref:ATP-binding cassette domain-containing protein n=1 Tax=Bifidobacterium sp. TaxID=41200 RepID=UPI0025BE3C05|nr:ATP-binding cassette domain-containing protein [Bifidobacterium sp.]MCH4209202.1 ATP-binding cassette domain-containing protein [Bifidobacterium sp.]MCI1224687.1 ATP-binding cassette domain-containing protein [Bifidobacterium sp.]